MLPAHYRDKERSYFCRFTFGQFFTLLVLEIFTLFFIFYLGARYGREFLGIRNEPTVKAEGNLPEVSTTDLDAVSTTRDPEIKALAKDILEAAPTPDLKKRVAEMLGDRGQRTENREQKLKTETENREQILEKSHKVITIPQPVIQTAPADAKFSIQVGSYLNVDEAHTMVGRWKAKGYSAFYVSADIPGKGRWYRVRLGSFQTKPEAQVFLSEFKEKENVEAFIASNF